MTPHKTARAASDDELVRECSAFHGYAELLHSMEHHAYVPTIHTGLLARVGRKERFRLAMRNELARRIIYDGYEVYLGNRRRIH